MKETEELSQQSTTEGEISPARDVDISKEDAAEQFILSKIETVGHDYDLAIREAEQARVIGDEATVVLMAARMAEFANYYQFLRIADEYRKKMRGDLDERSEYLLQFGQAISRLNEDQLAELSDADPRYQSYFEFRFPQDNQNGESEEASSG